MRFFSSLLLGGIILSGCAKDQPVVWPSAGDPSPRSVDVPPAFTNPATKLIVTPDIILVGKVVRFSSELRFVVLNFPIGHLPSVAQRLNVYRQGLKVGEVKVSGPQLDDLMVADIVAGEAQVGDEVRDR